MAEPDPNHPRRVLVALDSVADFIRHESNARSVTEKAIGASYEAKLSTFRSQSLNPNVGRCVSLICRLQELTVSAFEETLAN